LVCRRNWGSDTAWTFEPLPPDYGNEVLRKAGWDGVTPVLVVCPINPFWWPVKASLASTSPAPWPVPTGESIPDGLFSPLRESKVDRAYTRYLTSIGNAVDAFRKGSKVFGGDGRHGTPRRRCLSSKSRIIGRGAGAYVR